MATFNIHAAKTQLSRLLDDAAAGEEVIIARAGKPLVRLVPIGAEKPKRVLGILAHEGPVPDDFDAPLPDDVIDLFYRG
jgi:prevent-host-death family protein